MAGVVLVALFLLATLIGLFGTPETTNRNNLAQRLRPPDLSHPLGTDGFGRDILYRVLQGAPLALAVGVVSVAIGSLFGTVQGLIAGYYRGRLGSVIMGFTDAMLAFPTLLLALAVMATLGPGLANVMIAVGVSAMPRFTRMMEAEVLSVGQREFVTASRAIGATTPAILLRHILPNTLAPLLVQATYICASAMITEAILSFIGAGTPPNIPSWGNIMAEARSLIQVAGTILLFPGVFLSLTVLSVNLLGDGMRDALDPRLARRM